MEESPGIVDNLQNGIAYSLRIQAVNHFGCLSYSTWSKPVIPYDICVLFFSISIPLNCLQNMSAILKIINTWRQHVVNCCSGGFNIEINILCNPPQNIVKYIHTYNQAISSKSKKRVINYHSVCF